MKPFRASPGVDPGPEGTAILLHISLDKEGIDRLDLWCMDNWKEHLTSILEKKANDWCLSQMRYIMPRRQSLAEGEK